MINNIFFFIILFWNILKGVGRGKKNQEFEYGRVGAGKEIIIIEKWRNLNLKK